MTDNNNHKLSDDELGAFLGSKDAVSRAYGELDKASPSRELDERILARARAGVGEQESVAREPVFKEPIFSRPYATAATVFLCLAITFLFVNDPSVPIPADFRSQNAESNQRAVPVTLEQEQEADPEPADLEPGRESNDVTVSADTLEEEVARAPAAAAAERAADDEADATGNVGNSDGAAAPNRAESVDNLLELVEQRRLEETAEQRERSSALSAQSTFFNPGVEYRRDRDVWLQEIARLRAAGDTDSAGREEELFLESFPGTDIDAALAELE